MLKMSYLRGSANYVWSTTCVLGKGSTGAVYQGVNKATGDSVAVKTFNHVSQMRPVEVQMREFEVLRKVSHQNIVKLLAIEEEVETQSKVLVMELCTGGSLFTILDDPQNSYGLEEQEFLCVLGDLSAGMKYLRDNNIIHRDLKPGNIMKFICEDGKSVYKLTDFGAARELDDDQQFMSLYGTEEYLHPDMYERAVLRHSVGKSFRATVDLWSIGVTLYHLATGSLPFRPFGGRKNKEMMHYITTRKASGVISGVQYSENDTIEWSEELPKSCLLSQGLKELVTKLLAGVLECNAEKMWTFEKFFDAVTDILSCKVFHVFYMNEGREITIYLEPEKTMSQLKEEIASQTGVQTTNQLILFEKTVYDTIKSSDAKVSTHPCTTVDKPLILLNKDNTKIKVQTGMGTLSARFPIFHMSTINLEHDAAMAKSCCSIAHAVKRLIQKLARSYKLLGEIPYMLCHILFEDINASSKITNQITQRAEALDGQVKLLVTCQETMTKFLKQYTDESFSINSMLHLSKIVSEKLQSKAAINQHLCSISSKLKPLECKVLQSKQLQQDWDKMSSECIKLESCPNKAATYVGKIRDSWQALVRDKASRTLSYHDEQYHVLEKIKIQQHSQKLLVLLQEECIRNCQLFTKKLEEWYSEAQKTYSLSKIIMEELVMGADMVGAHSDALKDIEIKFKKCTEDLLLEIKIFNPQKTKLRDDEAHSRSANSGRRKSSKVLSADFLGKLEKMMKEERESKELLEENSLAIANLDSLLARYFSDPHGIGSRSVLPPLYDECINVARNNTVQFDRPK